MRDQGVRTVDRLRDLVKRIWLGPVVGFVILASAHYFNTRSEQQQDAIADLISTDVQNLTTPAGWSSLLTSMLVPAGSTLYYVILVAIGISGCQWFVGALRSLLAFIMGNVGATLLVFPYLLIGMSAGWVSESLRDTDDYGVSYALMSVLACTAMQPRTLWPRIVWWVVTVVVLIPFTTSSWGTYVMYGHFIATGIGVLLGWIYLRNRSPQQVESTTPAD